MRQFLLLFSLILVIYYFGSENKSVEVPHDQISVDNKNIETDLVDKNSIKISNSSGKKKEIQLHVVEKQEFKEKKIINLTSTRTDNGLRVDPAPRDDFLDYPQYKDLNLSQQDFEKVKDLQIEAMNFLSDQFADAILEDPEIILDISNPVYAKFLEDYSISLAEFMPIEDAERIVHEVIE